MQRLAMATRFQNLAKRHFSGGGAKPSWNIPKEQMWHPQIPDRQYYGEHPTYNAFVLFMRGLRPYLEKILGDTFNTGKGVVLSVYNPLSGYQLVALASFGLTSSYITHYFGSYYQSLVDVSTLTELAAAKDLDNEGFWLSQSQDVENRMQNYALDHGRLNKLWEDALSEATVTRSFDSLVNHLEVKSESVPASIPTRTSFRFNMLPYGHDNPDTQTFPVPSHEQPLRGFALSFTYNNLSGDWGDHINRRDNKLGFVRPARMVFTDVYIPTTK